MQSCFFRWEFTDGGKQIKQTVNSLATLAIGDAVFSSNRFTGTLFVDTTHEDEIVGFVFNYQDNKNFYVVTSSKEGSRQVESMQDAFTLPLHLLGNLGIAKSQINHWTPI